MVIRNWYLNQVARYIEVMPYEFPDGFTQLLQSKGIPVKEGDSSADYFLDWDRIPQRYNINYNLLPMEDMITKGLLISGIMEHEYVIMEYGYNDPVIKIQTRFFVLNWYKFIASTGFIGSVVLVESGSLFMEFTDDAETLLMSNFPIFIDHNNQ